MADNAEAPLKIAVPARVIRIDAPGGPGKDKLLELVRANVEDPAILEERGDPYIAGCVFSSTTIDSYFTYMDEATTLPNFAADAGDGIAVLDSHDSHRNGFGRSIYGVMGTDDKRLTTGYWYTFRGMTTSTGMKTDDYIDMMRASIMKDVSVGFFKRNAGAMIECSICGRDVFDWDCPHWLGERYISEDATTGDRIEKTAIGKVIDHNASEFSYVYKGANPDAEHAGTLHAPEAKVRMYADAGQITHKQGLAFERMYGFQIPNLSRLHDTYAVTKPITTQESDDMAWNDDTKRAFKGAFDRDPSEAELAIDAPEAFQRAVTAEREAHKDVVPKAEHETAVRAITEERDSHARRIAELEPEAANGRSYHASLVQDAIAADIRAMAPGTAETYNRDLMEGFFKRANVDELKTIIKTRADAADKVLGSGGRHSRTVIDLYAGDDKEPATDPDADLYSASDYRA